MLAQQKKLKLLKPINQKTVRWFIKIKLLLLQCQLKFLFSEIEKQLNKNLTGLIYEDDSLEDDKTKMKIWKTGKIKLD